ncbi:hypothetical protein ILYODFUR_004736 [Ilyodon furcidens]|uniref:Uncharacterized protein n=1 Tax=Ilyodon furcidens TaxID=33524 RepID=A0ABV0SU78_9TELE
MMGVKRVFMVCVSGECTFVLGDFQGQRGALWTHKDPAGQQICGQAERAKPSESSGGSETPSAPAAQPHYTYCFLASSCFSTLFSSAPLIINYIMFNQNDLF